MFVNSVVFTHTNCHHLVFYDLSPSQDWSTMCSIFLLTNKLCAPAKIKFKYQRGFKEK